MDKNFCNIICDSVFYWNLEQLLLVVVVVLPKIEMLSSHFRLVGTGEIFVVEKRFGQSISTLQRYLCQFMFLLTLFLLAFHQMTDIENGKGFLF